MAIYNDIVGKIEAGVGIYFGIDSSSGSIVINSNGGGGGGAVSSVTGTNGITCSPTTGAVVVGIDSTYIGQTSITTLGAISSGTWSAGNVTTPVIGLKSLAGVVSIIANPQANSNTYTLPATVGNIGQVLQVSSYSSGQTSLTWSSLAKSDIANLTTDLTAITTAINSIINSEGNANGLATLDGNSKINLPQIPSIAIASVNVLPTIAARNLLTGVVVGNVAIVTSDPNSSNNGSYIYNGASWSTLSVYIQPVNLSSLTDCNTAGAANDKLLMYTTYNSSNKWTPYTISGVTIDDAAKTITVPAATALQATGAAIINVSNAAVPSINQALIANSSTTAIWQTINHLNLSNIGTNTHAQIDTFLGKFNLGTPASNQVLQYNGSVFSPATLSIVTSLNGLTDCSTTGVVNDQLLVYTTAGSLNKWTSYTLSGATFNDNSKTITISSSGGNAAALQTTTTAVNVSSAVIPSANQALVATNGATAIWQTINHLNLSNIGTNTHAQIDTFLGKFNLGTPASNQVLQYNGSVFSPATLSIVTSLNGLTDCSTTGVVNDQLLVYTTAGSLNKWTSYTLSGATFNDNSKTITISSSGGNAAALQTTTTAVNVSSAVIPSANQALVATNGATAIWQTIDHLNLSNIGTNTHTQIDTFLGKFSLGTPTNGNLLIYNFASSKWINSDSIPDNLLFVYDDGDSTRKMQFQLSGITSGQTRVLTIPDASTIIVGTDATQNLTNKTITDGTNVITATNIRSDSNVMTISGTATANQILKATGATTATWSSSSSGSSTINSCTDVTVTREAVNDILVWNGTNYVNSNALTNVQSTLTSYNQVQLELTKTTSNVTKNQTISAYYTDNSDGNMIFINNADAVIQTPISIVQVSSNPFGTFSISGNYVTGGGCSGGINTYARVNIAYTTAFVCDYFSASTNWQLDTTQYPATVSYSFYGSNLLSCYNDTSLSTSGLTLLYTVSVTTPNTLNLAQTISDLNTYLYFHCVILITSTTLQRPIINNLEFRKKAGGYTPITNYSISSNQTDGTPVITYTGTTTNNILFNYPRLAYSELCRRVFNVCRTNSLINLSGTNYAWQISNDTSNDTLVFKRNAVQLMTIDQNANMSIAMINSCTLLSTCTWNGNTIDVSHGGSGVSSYSYNNCLLCSGTSSNGSYQTINGGGNFGQFLMSNGNNLPIWRDSIGARMNSVTPYAILCGGTTNTDDIKSLSTGSSGQVLMSNGSNALPSWNSSPPVILSYDYSFFLHINMFGSNTYYDLDASISYVFVDQSNNNVKYGNIILPTTLNNGRCIYIQGCGSNNMPYYIGIAADLTGGVRLYSGYNSYIDVSNAILANTTYKYTYYDRNQNPDDLTYNYPSWSCRTVSSNRIPFNNDSLHLIYTNNNQSTVGRCDLGLNNIATGQEIRFRDIGGNLSTTQLQIFGDSSFTIDYQTSETLNTNGLSKLFVLLGGNLLSL